MIQQFSLGLWLLYDHAILSAKIGWTKSNENHNKKANIFWLIAMLMGIKKIFFFITKKKVLLNLCILFNKLNKFIIIHLKRIL